MSGWLPGVERIPGNDSGSWAPDDENAPKVVWHTTEGGTIGGAVSAYKANNSWPHLTADPVRKRIVQHIPLDRPARALRNTSAPGQTNREGRVAQIEVVCTSKTKAPPGLVSLRDLTDDQLAWLGSHVARPVSAAIGCPLTTSVTFYGDDAGWTLATENARQRLTAAQWDTYTGHLAHQHVPENHHWDGPFDMAAILAAARGTDSKPPTPAPQEHDDMGTAYRDPRDGKVWIVTPAGRWHVPTRPQLDELVFVGLVKPFDGQPAKWPAGSVAVLDRIPVLEHKG